MLNADEAIDYLGKLDDDPFKISSKLSPEVLALIGFSSSPVRHLFNNICSNIEEITYLEVGLYAGSTFISTLYGNEKNIIAAYGIDDWSGDQGYGGKIYAKEVFSKSVDQLLTPDYIDKIITYDENSWTFDLSKIKHKINMFFYDGDHSISGHENALTYFKPILDDVFIFIVDDFNWDFVREGTYSGIEKNNYKILYQKELYTPDKANCSLASWWNGLFIGVLQKEK
jgi:hypothetical protein